MLPLWRLPRLRRLQPLLSLCAALGASLGLLPGALAHPSGLPQLGVRVGTAAASTDQWLFWDFHPSIVIGIGTAMVLYRLASTTWREKYYPHEQRDLFRERIFYGNMTFLWFVLDGPLHHLSDNLLFTAHMVQHLALQLVWAPLVVVGIPRYMWRRLVFAPWVQRLGYRITRPRAAFITFNISLLLWHIPRLYNLALREHAWHIVEHLHFMSGAVIFWWPLLSPLPEIPRATHGRQVIYVLATMIPMKALGIAISLQERVLYTFYLGQPRVWGVSALDDQRVGGLLMWLPGGLLLWAGLGYVFYQWSRGGTPKRGTTGIPAIDAARERERRLAEAVRRGSEAGALKANPPIAAAEPGA